MRIALFIMLLIAAWQPALAGRICDEGRAREYCDSALLHRIEGIWEYPDDETRVLVKRASDSGHSYEIILLESPDCRVSSGDVIGHIRATANPVKYEMSIFRTVTDHTLGNPGKCVAELDEKNGAIYVTGRKLKFRLRNLWFLPRFWRMIGVKESRRQTSAGHDPNLPLHRRTRTPLFLETYIRPYCITA